jgi:long-chain acyl-CoA synthetase
MIEWFGPEVLVEYWGSSEVGTVSLISAGEWLEHAGSVGRPVDGWSVTVRDDDGQPLRDGQVGTLFCASTSGERRFSYHGDADKTEAAHLGVEFTPGDLGWIDNGYIYLSGRASNMIISGGVNVYPAEVEAVLARHPAVLDVAVFGIPDDEWGERVHGAVSLVPPAEGSAVDSPADDRSGLIDEILGFCRQHLARYKCPRSLDIHDALPRRDDGKLAVRTLRDPYWQGRSRKI